MRRWIMGKIVTEASIILRGFQRRAKVKGNILFVKDWNWKGSEACICNDGVWYMDIGCQEQKSARHSNI